MSTKIFDSISNQLKVQVLEWATKLSRLHEDEITNRQNAQNRSIKQIIGHMVDSASNNTHRAVHLQYQKSPLEFPNYATYGNNEKWIAIQYYQDENWENLVQLWKYSHLHFLHIIQNINPSKLDSKWIADENQFVSLTKMIEDFPPHFELHISEIEELLN